MKRTNRPKNNHYFKRSGAQTAILISTVGLWLALCAAVAAGEVSSQTSTPKIPPTAVEKGDFGSPHPEAAPELAQFAFLIGHWQCEVDFVGNDWQTRHKGQAQWTAYYALDGYAIMDDFRGGFGEGYIATTFRAYDRQKKQWQGYWLDGVRGRWSQPLQGQARDDGMLLKTATQVVSPEGEVIKVDLQYQFYDIEPNRFSWRQNASTDSGKTWRQDTVSMSCRRLAGPKH